MMPKRWDHVPDPRRGARAKRFNDTGRLMVRLADEGEGKKKRQVKYSPPVPGTMNG